MIICHICLSDDVYYDGNEPLICDKCDEYYCHDCSYTFSIHFEYYGMMCYHCSDQRRLKPLNKRDMRINYILRK